MTRELVRINVIHSVLADLFLWRSSSVAVEEMKPTIITLVGFLVCGALLVAYGQ